MNSLDNNFVLLTTKDVKRLMEHKNQTLVSRQILETTKTKTLAECDNLRKQLTEALAKGDVDIEEIAQKMADEKLGKSITQHQVEMDQMSGFLQSKIERNLNLEVELDEIKDAYRALEKNLLPEERQQRNKVSLLERSMEQLNAMYQNIINERSILKVDLQVSERKMQKSLQRQQLLEKKYEQQRKKNEQLEKIIVEIRNDYVHMKKNEE